MILVSQATYLAPADAARELGVSAKALRLWEDRGLLTPGRTIAGWRTYGPSEMARAREIAALRGLGLSLTQIAQVLDGDAEELEPALAAHQSGLEAQVHRLADTIGRVRTLRETLAAGAAPALADIVRLQAPAPELIAAFDLPWPWGGERFELHGLRPLTWIVGPLGSGKTKLAERLAREIPNAAFVGLDRCSTFADDAHRDRVGKTLGWLAEDGAIPSEPLKGLMTALEDDRPAALVVDLIEHGLEEPTQLALAAWLRRRGREARPIFAMTRSSAMLDLAAAGQDEAIIFCPANHSPPILATPRAGAPGYEAVATCLGAPAVRARTEGVIAFRPPAA